ncbi:DUF6567 family protein [Perlabentimonas gracilis]|uniref:DUF6567 family protein n=1 Tax=Perlabentimonas gracilis TaxID=2715279 RepID=UPI0014099098|nr:DUF6567 family protein [Perlabentimonas gracilis]NHB70312.1 hypothetical protein [Perlabentimonas gracilis]
MKKLALVFIVAMFMLSGCAFHNGLTTNQNNHTTEVVLSQKNFRVVESVRGESEARYIFGIGGLARNAMISEARASMLAKANIVGTSRAIVNETVEIKRSIFPFVSKYKVTVSGHVVEFF